MIVAMFHIKVEPERKEVFEKAFAARSGLIDQMPSFLGLDVLRHSEGKDHVILTRWQRREEMEAWLRSPAWLQAHMSVRIDPEKARPGVDMYLDVYERVEA